MKQLTLTNATLRYSAGSEPLHAVEFALNKAETVAIVAPSGAGKTSLINALAGLLPLHAGQLHWGQRRFWSLSGSAQRDLRRQVQPLFQDAAAALSPRRTIAQTLHEPLQIHWPQLDLTERQVRIDQWLSTVELPQKMLSRYPHMLSGGERQRVALVRALLCEPSFLLADEPMSALDVVSKLGLCQLLIELQQRLGFGLLLATHDQRVARYVCDRQITLQGGGLVETG